MSSERLRRDFTEFNWIATQSQFKYVISGVQGIEYIIDPTLHRRHFWSLERIEILLASPFCQRIEIDYSKVCSLQNPFFLFSKNQSSFPCIVSNWNFHSWTRHRARRELVDAKISTEINSIVLLTLHNITDLISSIFPYIKFQYYSHKWYLISELIFDNSFQCVSILLLQFYLIFPTLKTAFFSIQNVSTLLNVICLIKYYSTSWFINIQVSWATCRWTPQRLVIEMVSSAAAAS